MVDKIKLVPISGANNYSNVNDNFVKIEKVINDNLLSRKVNSGEPNQMQTDLDMNNKRIYNLPPPQSPTEPLTAGYIGDLTDLVNTAQENIAASQVLVDGANEANAEARQILEDTHLALDGALGAIQTQTTNSLNQINSTSAVILADMTAKQQDVSTKAATVAAQAAQVNNQSVQVANDTATASAAASGAAASAATATTAASQAQADAISANSSRAQAQAASTAANTSAAAAAADAVTASGAADRAKAAASGVDTAYLLNRANHTGTQAMSTVVGLKTAATYDIGTTGAKVPLIGQENTWDVNQKFTSVNNGQLAGQRNRMVNGSFTYNQRGVDYGIPANGSYVHTQDCWMAFSSNGGNMNNGSVTDTPSPEFQASNRFEKTSNPGAGTWSTSLHQGLDGSRTSPLIGKQVTFSFWVKSSRAGTSSVAFISDPGGTNNKMIVKAYTINAANTWERKSITLPAVPVTTPKGQSSLSLQIVFHLGCSSDVKQASEDTAWKPWTAASGGITGSTAYLQEGPMNGTVQFAGVQLEAGTVATPYEHINSVDELALCQRYLKVIVATGGITGVTFVSNGDSRSLIYSDSVWMRAKPTILAIPSNITNIVVGPDGTVVNSTHEMTLNTNVVGTRLVITALGNMAAISRVGAVAAWGSQASNTFILGAEFF